MLCTQVLFYLHVLQLPLRVDVVKMEPDVSKLDGDQVKREHGENILAEESDGMCVCLMETFQNTLICVQD